MSGEELDGCPSIGLDGLAEKMQAVSALLERRRSQVDRRDALIREAVWSLLRPVPPDGAHSRDEPVPRPASRLAGLRSVSGWQRALGRHWLVAADLLNESPREVPYPALLLSAGVDEPLTYQTRLVSLPFVLDERLDERPTGLLPPGQTVRTIAVVELPASVGGAGCRLSLALTSPPGQRRPDNDVGFYQLPAGDVTLGAGDLLSRRLAPFTGGGVTSEDEQAVWALSRRRLRLWLEPGTPTGLAVAERRLAAAGFVRGPAAFTPTDAGHPLFGCLVLLTPGDTEERLSATVWVRDDGQLPLLLHQLRQLFDAGCQLRSARHLHDVVDLRAALVAQLEFVEARLDGAKVAAAPERRTLRLGDVHVPVSEYEPWRRRLTELEDATAACALDLLEPDEALS